jgi:acetyl-CoA carboxylase/biotin carboxylase 1
VDALVDYKHPVFIYIPPGGELRGGSWVVVDPAINPSHMEMYADVKSRGGILEPAGIVEVKFRQKQQLELMHRLDERLADFDRECEAASNAEEAAIVEELEAKIKQCEEKLKPLYTQIACEFADLHDRTGRMQAVGVIRKGLEWRRSRAFFFQRLRRRLLQRELEGSLMKADDALTPEEAHERVQSWLPSDNDEEVAEYLESKPLEIEEAVANAAVKATKRKIEELAANLPEDERRRLLA